MPLAHLFLLIADCIHTLVCAMVLLNTDLHDGSIAMISGHRRMTAKQFQRNLEGLGPGGNDFSPELLKECYKYIRKQPLPVCEYVIILPIV